MAFADSSAYGRFMGRWSTLLSEPFLEYAAVGAGQRVLDVGCGPGVLTDLLVERQGADLVAGIDPSTAFITAARERFPGVELVGGTAERLPFPDGAFDASLAQLVVHFMSDPPAAIREMARVVRVGGVVAVTVWDVTAGPVGPFWSAVRTLDPERAGPAERDGTREGDLVRLLAGAGLEAVDERPLEVQISFETFEEWWEPYMLGVGPAGDHVAGLVPTDRDRLRERCRTDLPPPPFVQTARAWAARGSVEGQLSRTSASR